MLNRIVTILCLGILSIFVIAVLVNISLKIRKRAELITFFRSFKKGKFAFIYIVAIPLYFIGFIYSGSDIPQSLFSAIAKAVNLVVLKYEIGTINKLMADDLLYSIAIYMCFILVGINAIIFTISLTSQFLWEKRRSFKVLRKRGNKLFIFGNNSQNEAIYLSEKARVKNGKEKAVKSIKWYKDKLKTKDLSKDEIKESKKKLKDAKITKKNTKVRDRVIIDKMSSAESEKLYIKNISFISADTHEKPIDKIFKLAEKCVKKFTRAKKLLKKIRKLERDYIIVINTQDDEKNIEICRALIKRIDKVNDEIRKNMFLKLNIYVFGSPKYEAIYEDIVSCGYGCIHFENKYREIAADFIEKYPLARFMDETQIDYETSYVKDDVDINVLFIGFGKTAQHLFLASVANNQFIEKGDDVPKLKKVNYYIFDKIDAKYNKNLNHTYYRFKNERDELKGDYLPFPELPANEEPRKLDVNDTEFYKDIRKIVSRNNKDANFIVIAFGTDLENIDMGKKLAEKRNEWGLDNLVIFVKVRSMSIEDNGCYFIGNENEIVYNIEKLTDDCINNMARQRNWVYDIEYNKQEKIKQIEQQEESNKENITNNKENIEEQNEEKITINIEMIENQKKESNKAWHTKLPKIRRESNVYCSLSLRSKLNLMGLDYCEIKYPDDCGIGDNDYIKIYAFDDELAYEKVDIPAGYKKIVDYKRECADPKRSDMAGNKLRRRDMAIQEKYRWNAFYISKGYIPASIDQITKEPDNGKNDAVRRHGCLTTFDGLMKFEKITETEKIDEKTGEKSTENNYVHQYDYQILDDAWWFLNDNGYKIIKLEKLPASPTAGKRK